VKVAADVDFYHQCSCVIVITELIFGLAQQFYIHRCLMSVLDMGISVNLLTGSPKILTGY